MDIFINYLIKNKEWIFSGLGIFVIGGIISLIKILINHHKLCLNVHLFCLTHLRSNTFHVGFPNLTFHN